VRVALILAAAALLAASCGAGKPAASAAEVAPADTYLLAGGRATPATEHALAFLPEARLLERLLVRARALTGSGGDAQVALLDRQGRRAVAFAHPADRKALERQLDSAGIVRARIRGWTVFSRQRSAVDAVRHAKRHLADATWFRAASGDVVFVRRSGTVTARTEGDHAVATRTEPVAGTVAAQPLSRLIPEDAVAAAAFHDGGAVLAALPFAEQLREGLGIDAATLARAAPADAALFARSAVPAATVTLLANGSSPAAVAAVVHELAPHAPPGVATTLDGVAATDVGLGPVDLLYGVNDSTVFITDDPDAKVNAAGPPLTPPGLPERTAGWAYLDVERGLPALVSLAALSGTRLSPGFLRRLGPIRTVLAYRTRGLLSVDVRQLPLR
jgi:hypothetical protein